VGAGRFKDISFAEQARAIMDESPWATAPTCLLDDEGPVTADRVWEAAREHTVIHFSCHGMEDPTALDTLSALYLELSDHERWTAKDIFERKDGLSAELVFLNACMSGRFRLREGLAIGGFWEAFLRAGARSLVGTLAPVHPEAAETLARTFYQRWLREGITKARALQRAQQELRDRNPDAFQWARYVLIGDHR
jgi:CHAT domain-containing protein